MSVSNSHQPLIDSLRREVARLEAPHPLEDDRLLSTGVSALDDLLPHGGLQPGTLIEYLTSVPGSGATILALSAAKEACRDGRAFIVLDTLARSASEGKRSSYFYPLAAAHWGIDLSCMLVLRPTTKADTLWALDQALRCPGVGAVWAACDRIDVRDFRRLQLAAECGGTIGLLMRPARRRGQPTWADVQWQVMAESKVEGRRSKVVRPKRLSTFDFRPSAWQLRVELVRCRGAAGGQSVLLELDEKAGIWREVTDHATHSLSSPSRVANPAGARRA